jgi:hypothetical protein
MQEVLVNSTSHLGPASPLLRYLAERCLQEVPEDRPTYQELAFLLSRLLEQLEGYYYTWRLFSDNRVIFFIVLDNYTFIH